MKQRYLYAAVLGALVLSRPAVSPAMEQAETAETAEEKRSNLARKKEADAKLDEIVVTATRTAESRKDIPASVHVINEEAIKSSSAKDVGELLAEAGIGHVHKYNMALATRIEIRGLTTDSSNEVGNRIMVLVNGNRAGTSNIAKIPVADIERVEVVKGPASVVYGSQAMGGVINIITKKGKGELSGSILAEGGSWGYWKTAAELGGTKHNVDFYATASKSEAKDFSSPGHGRIENTHYDTEDLSTRLGYTFLKDHRIAVGFQHWETEHGSPGYWWKPELKNHNDKERNAIDVEYANSTLTAKYYLTLNKDTYNYPSSTPYYQYFSRTRSQGASLQNVFPIGNHRILVGAEWARVELESRRTDGKKLNSPDTRNDNYAVFTEGKLDLFTNRLILTAGMRYDYFDNSMLATANAINATEDVSKTMDHLTFRGGIVYKVNDALSLRGSIGTAFRAPAPLEIAADYNSTGTKHVVGNPDLKPEKSITYEAGIDFNYKELKSSFAFFHTDFSDKIYQYRVSGIDWSYKNVPGAIIQGVEMDVSYDMGWLTGLDMVFQPYANVTYKTRYESSDPAEIAATKSSRLLYIPEWTGAFGIRAARENWEGRMVFNYQGTERILSYENNANGEYTDKGGFLTASIKGSYRPVKSLELSLAVNNLFDRRYEYVNGYAMAGRTFIGGAKWLF